MRAIWNATPSAWSSLALLAAGSLPPLGLRVRSDFCVDCGASGATRCTLCVCYLRVATGLWVTMCSLLSLGEPDCGPLGPLRPLCLLCCKSTGSSLRVFCVLSIHRWISASPAVGYRMHCDFCVPRRAFREPPYVLVFTETCVP